MTNRRKPEVATPPVAILCNPGSRRAQEHVRALWGLGYSAPRLHAYGDLLSGLDLVDAIADGALLRIESPGEHDGVERQLIALGAELAHDASKRAQGLSAAEALALPHDFGRYWHQAQLRRGLEAMYRGVAAALARRPDVRSLNPPDSVLTMSDKRRCREVLGEHGVPMPPALTGRNGEDLGTPDELRAALTASGWNQVFVKPRFGSSAAGIIALRSRAGDWLAYTTLERAESAGDLRYYNSRRVRRIEGEPVDALLELVLGEGAVVERWIPKRSDPASGAPFDIRVVCIAGEPRQAVVRLGRSTITNLHLGNDRAEFSVFASAMPAAAREVQRVARAAAAAFPHSLTASVDVLIEARRDRALVLEVNSFGELLNDVRDRGETTYESIWRAALAGD